MVAELIAKGKINKTAITVNGTIALRELRGQVRLRPRRHQGLRQADAQRNAGFLNFKGNLFDSAIMKTSVISEEFRQRYLSNPKDPNAFEGRAIVFDGPEDYHHRIDDPKLEIDATLPAVHARHRARSAIPAPPRSSTCARRTTC